MIAASLLLALYALAVGTAAAGAAWLAERAALRLGIATRWAWAAALALTVALSALALVRAVRPAADLSGPAPVVAVAGTSLAARPAATAWRARLSLPRGAPWSSSDRVALLLWALLSSGAAARRLAALRRVRRLAAGWPARDVRGVTVRLSDDVGPAVLGVLHPQILLPAWALDEPRLDAMLAHERAHVASRDSMLLAAAAAVTVLLPWHPAVRWMAARLRAAVEVDCDERVLATRTIDIRSYAVLLLDVAGRPAAAHAALALAEGPATLHRRIHVMSSPRSDRRPIRALPAAAAALLLAASTAALPRPAVARPIADAGAGAVQVVDSMPRARAKVTGVPPGDSAHRGVLKAKRPDGPPPLYVVNGKVMPARRGADGAPDGLPTPDRIASVNVLKGQRAIDAYGVRGTHGVVEITTKP